MTWNARHNRHSSTEEQPKHGDQTCKISDEFARRLAKLAPDETVRAVVMPTPYFRNSAATRRLRGEERQAILREARQHTEASFQEIDEVLARTGGQRLSTTGNALGYILIETNAAGIDAVSSLDWVNAVMEDQAIYPHRDPNAYDPNAPDHDLDRPDHQQP